MIQSPATPLRTAPSRRLDAVPLGVVALAVVAIALAGCARPQRAHPAVGRSLGDLPLESLSDEPRDPPRWAGRVTLLNVWGTWCPPCRRELPGLERLARGLADDPRFQLVAVSCGPGGADDRDEIARETDRFLRSARLTLDAWCDPTGLVRGLLADGYGFEVFPTTYLVGADRRVLRVWAGFRSRDEAEMAAAIVEALKACPAPESGDDRGTAPPSPGDRPSR